MSSRDRRVLLVRTSTMTAGSGPMDIGEHRSLGRLAVNFHVRRDVRASTINEIAALVAEPYRRRAHKYARELDLFRSSQTGTRVVTVLPGKRRLMFGTLTGSYIYDSQLMADHPHTRAIAWDAAATHGAVGVAWRFSNVAWLDPSAEIASGLLADGVARRTSVSESNRLSLPPTHTAVGWRPEPPPLARASVSWPPRDEPQALTVEVEPCSRSGCGPTHSCHRFWLPVDLLEDRDEGHDLLVVGFNPTCPDAGNAPTLANIRWFAEHVGARSVCIVNLLSRRSSSRGALPNAGLVQHSHNVGVIATAVRRASLVLAGWGSAPVPQVATAACADALAEFRRSIVANPAVQFVSVGPRQMHPAHTGFRAATQASLRRLQL